MFELKGKIAVVTGASSGLGADAAMAYAKEGADLAILARRKEKLDAVAEDIRAQTGRKVLSLQCHVTEEEQVKAAVEATMAEYGHIDILLNNAGIALVGGVDTLSERKWERSMNANAKSVFLMSKYVVPHMIEQKYGKIVNISSINAMLGDKDDMFIRHSYNASKAAVRGLTLGMACSYGKYNITVNAIGPGLFETEMTADSLFKSQEYLETYNSICPMGRPSKKGELNGTVLYLSSDASSYVTGQYITVTGGLELV